MPIPGLHDVRANVVTIKGLQIPPSGEGEFVSHTFPDDVSAVELNDGQAVRNILPNRTATATFTVSPYSVAHKRLGALYLEQQGQGAAFTGFPYQYRNSTNGDAVSGNAWIMKRPDVAAGREQADVTWTLHLAEVVRVYGALLPDSGA